MYVIRYDSLDGDGDMYRGTGSVGFKDILQDVEPFETAEAALTAFYTSGFSREAYTIIGVEEKEFEGECLRARGEGEFYVYGEDAKHWMDNNGYFDSSDPVPLRLETLSSNIYGPIRIYSEKPTGTLVEGEPI